MRSPVLVMFSLALLSAFAPVAAHGGWTHCGDDDVEVGSYPDVLYVLFDDEDRGVYLYAESNGVEHLQRGGTSPYIPDDNESCVEAPTMGPEMLIF